MKCIFKIFIFILILFILIETLSLFFLPTDNVKKYGIYKASSYEILDEKENTIDVIALGDSLVYSSLSPMEIWNNFGYTVFDCAEPAQIIPDSYEYLKVAIESQHPKIIIMEANVLYRNPNKKPILNKIYKKIKNYFPIFKYHNNWKKYLKFGKKDNWINVDKGYKYITKVEPSKNKNYMKFTKKSSSFLKGNLEYFEKIIKLCEDNNIKLVLVSFPSQSSWNYKKHMGMKKISRKYNVEFIDLNLEESLKINWQKETKDKGAHLNYLGAKKVSHYMGNYLKSTNLVKDHRNDNKYESWHKAYKLYSENLNNN